MLTKSFQVAHIGQEESKSFGPLIPLVVVVTKQLVSLDEDKAAEAMEIFEELFETEIPLVRKCLALLMTRSNLLLAVPLAS